MSDERLRERFEERGYVHVPGFLDPEVRALAWEYAQQRIAGTPDGQRIESTSQQVPGAPGIYGDGLMEALLARQWPRIEAITGLALWPSHSYWRMYRHGDDLYVHTDDDPIEVNASVCLGYRGQEPWPLYVEDGTDYTGASRPERLAPPDPDRARAIRCEPGDCLVYRGPRVKHWRERNPHGMHAQLFLFFVEREGAHAHRKLDGRPMLGWQDPVRWRTSDVTILLRGLRGAAAYRAQTARRRIARLRALVRRR